MARFLEPKITTMTLDKEKIYNVISKAAKNPNLNFDVYKFLAAIQA